MTEPDQYVLGYRRAEQERLQRQAQELAHESSWLFDQLGDLEGARVVEIGCGPHGCLELLSERVGPSGSVVGVERSQDAVDLAREMIDERGLSNVEVLCGDARSTGAAARLVRSRDVAPRARQRSGASRDRCRGCRACQARRLGRLSRGGLDGLRLRSAVRRVDDVHRTLRGVLREERHRSVHRSQAATPASRGWARGHSRQPAHSRLPAGSRPSLHHLDFAENLTSDCWRRT